jgi:hypothetical protein
MQIHYRSAITHVEATKRRIYVFVTGSNGHLYVNYWNGSKWQWANQGTPPGTLAAGPPGVITYKEATKQRVYAFVTGANGHLYVNYWKGSKWQWADQGAPPGATATAAPGVITYKEATKQRIYAFVTGSNGNLYMNCWNGSRWRWSDQGNPPFANATEAPDVITYKEATKQRIYAFVTGSRHLHVNYWDGSNWHWSDHGFDAIDPVWGAPGAITYEQATKQRIYVFVRFGIGLLLVNYWNGSKWQWSDQGPVSSASGAGVISYPAGTRQRIYAFVNCGGTLRLNYGTGLTWQWRDQGQPPDTSAAGVPAVVTFREATKQKIYAFITGSNGHLYANYWDGSKWRWSDQGTFWARPT